MQVLLLADTQETVVMMDVNHMLLVLVFLTSVLVADAMVTLAASVADPLDGVVASD